MSQLAATIVRALRPLGTKERSVHEQAYLKSDLVHLGVTMPKLRAAVKALGKGADRATVIEAVEAMWPRGIFELRSASVELLVLAVKRLEAKDLKLLERLLRESHTWALVDALSTAVVSPLVEANPALAKTLDRWATDDDFWIRRSAMLALLVPMRKGGGETFSASATTRIRCWKTRSSSSARPSAGSCGRSVASGPSSSSTGWCRARAAPPA